MAEVFILVTLSGRGERARDERLYIDPHDSDPRGVDGLGVTFEHIDHTTGVVDLDYWLVPTHWGRDRTESFARFCRYGFDQLRIRKLVAHVSGVNDASKRLLRGVGFVEESIQHEQVFVADESQDQHWCGLLRRERERARVDE